MNMFVVGRSMGSMFVIGRSIGHLATRVGSKTHVASILASSFANSPCAKATHWYRHRGAFHTATIVRGRRAATANRHSKLFREKEKKQPETQTRSSRRSPSDRHGSVDGGSHHPQPHDFPKGLKIDDVRAQCDHLIVTYSHMVVIVHHGTE